MERLLEILSISNGKALVLFTAKADMEEVYSILSEKNLPYKILMQQPGSCLLYTSAMTLVSMANTGEDLFPAEVIFTKAENRIYADII